MGNAQQFEWNSCIKACSDTPKAHPIDFNRCFSALFSFQWEKQRHKLFYFLRQVAVCICFSLWANTLAKLKSPSGKLKNEKHPPKW